jgi:hypothetical protein
VAVGRVLFRVHVCRSWTCRILGSKTSPFLRKVSPACKDKVEIKCMGSVGGKHQQNHNFIYSTLTLGTLNKITIKHRFIL